MKILLDECVDRRLARDLTPHDVITVPRKGGAGIKNGELLALAEKEFDVLLTVDSKIPTEQKLDKFQIAVVLLRARSNRLADLRPLVAHVLEALPHVAAGTVTVVSES